MRIRTLLPILFALFTPVAALAQADFGKVVFANSGAPAAQEPFLRGLALLHDFEYPHAAEEFQKAQQIDPGFVMAYWGEAMTYNHPVWFQQDLAKARAVLQRLGPTAEGRAEKAKTQRERDYLHAVEILYGDGAKEDRDFKYADAMAVLHDRHPDDVDATAFYALSLLGTAHHGRDFATYMKSAALLEEVFPTHQGHPGVLHYLIHSYDDPIHAPLGMRAARLYGAVAPQAGHALHMTSHIFIALGMWDELIAANRRAIAVVNASRAAKSVPPRGCGHYVTWLEYGLLQEGRFDDARQALDDCRAEAMATIEKPAATPIGPDESLLGSLAEMRVLQLIDSGRWDVADAATIPEGLFIAARFTTTYGEALSAAARGDGATLRNAVSRLHDQRNALLVAIEQRKLSNPAEKMRAGVIVDQADAMELIAEGKKTEGIALLRTTAESETGKPLEFGPPLVEKPTFELLGDSLISIGKPAEAESVYRSALSRTPGRRLSLLGLLSAQKALGKKEEAEETARLLAKYVRATGAPPFRGSPGSE
jgi:tetratricopeptide (TPR) repeat protein